MIPSRYDGFYLIESSKSPPHKETVSISIYDDMITWGNVDRKFIKLEEIGDEKLQVFLPDEVLTLSKVANVVKEVNPFKIAHKKKLDAHVDTLNFDSNTPAVSSQSIKETFLEKEKKAIKGFYPTAYALIQKSLPKLAEQFDENFIETDVNALELFQISDETLESIFNLAIEQYEKQNFFGCLALFHLLTRLRPTEFDLWYRRGIAAQACEKYDQALDVFEIARLLNPKFLDVYLYIIECNLELGRKDAATASYVKLEQLTDQNPPSEENQQLLADAKSLLGIE